MNRYLFLFTFLVVGYLLYPTVFNVTAEAGSSTNTPSGNTPTIPSNTTTNNTTSNNTSSNVNQCSPNCNTEHDYIITFNPDGTIGFMQGCVVPTFAVDGTPVCPIAYIINTAGNLCMAAACAPPGGSCIKCSDCPTGQGAGACRLICKESCP